MALSRRQGLVLVRWQWPANGHAAEPLTYRLEGNRRMPVEARRKARRWLSALLPTSFPMSWLVPPIWCSPRKASDVSQACPPNGCEAGDRRAWTGSIVLSQRQNWRGSARLSTSRVRIA